MSNRKGFFTREQEKQIDKLLKLKGVAEALDGTVIRVVDNSGLEKLKAKIPKEHLPSIYEVVDEVMKALESITIE